MNTKLRVIESLNNLGERIAGPGCRPKEIAEAIHLIDQLDSVRQDAENNLRNGCEFCGRGKPIKAYTYLPDCGLQYRPTVIAKYCPVCGAKMDGGADECTETM